MIGAGNHKEFNNHRTRSQNYLYGLETVNSIFCFIFKGLM